jgi:hypothetical protein
MAAMMIGGRTEATKLFLVGSFTVAVLLIYGLGLALIIYYIILIRRETDLTSNQKYSWGTIIVFINALAFPVVWYQFVWPKAVGAEGPAWTAGPAIPRRRKVIWLGLLSWVPLCALILSIGTLILAGPVLRSPDRMLPYLAVTMTIVGIGTISLVTYYSMVISRNPNLTSEQKLNWYWYVFVLGLLIFPLLWFKFVRSNVDPGGDTMTGPSTDGDQTDG